MKVTPIRDPLPGERVVGVSPEMSPTVRSEWHRRLNLYTGRTLSHRALITEQEQRAGRLATRGQTLSPGVVSGLEVGLEVVNDEYYYTIMPGQGIAGSGEDVWLSRALRVTADAVPVYSASLPIGDAPMPPGPNAGVLVLQPVVADLDDELTSDDPCEEDEQNYAYEDWQRVDGCRLLFYPWPSEGFGALPAFGERWRNRIAYAIFDSERRLGPDDLLPWEEVGVPIALVAYGTYGQRLFVDRGAVVRAGGKPKRRTQLLPGVGQPFLWQARLEQFAEQVAEAGPQVAPGELAAQFRYLPPVGLLPKDAIEAREQRDHFFPTTYQVTALPVPEEQLDIAVEASASLRPFDTFTPDQVQVLVPVPEICYEPRLLVVEEVDPEFAEAIERFVTRRARWLRRRDDLRFRAAALRQALRRGPSTPLPLDRADDELPATTPAQMLGGSPPFAVAAGGQLHFVVNEQTDHITFSEESVADLEQITIEELDALLRAQGIPVRAAADPATGRLLLMSVARGENVKMNILGVQQSVHERFGLKADEAVTGATDATNPLDPDDPQLSQREQSYGTAAARGTGQLIVQAIEALRQELRTKTPLRRETVVSISKPPKFPSSYADRLRYDQDRKALIFTGRMTPQERVALRAFNDDQEFRAVVDRIFNASQNDELSQLDQLGLEPFIWFLQAKVDRANDTIDLGFLRVQTDIYRIRQSILGVSAATRLATSPVLAGIAKGDTAVATRESLSRFLEEAKGRRVDPTSPSNATPTPPPELLSGIADIFERDRRGLSEAPTASAQPPSGEVFAPEPGSRGLADLDALANIRDRLIDPTNIRDQLIDPTNIRDQLFDPSNIRDQLLTPPLVQAPSRTPSPLISLQTAQLQPTLLNAVELLREPSKEDIAEQPPIIGKAYDFRTATVAERLEKSESLEAKTFTVASKYAVVSSLANLDLNVDDLKVPGFIQTNADGQKLQVELDFATIKGQGMAGQILQGLHDPDPANGDEAAFFATGIKAIDHSVATMRVIEGRIQAYKSALELCRKTLSVIQDLIRQIDQRLAVIGGELAEARHDVAVARALLAEEQARIQAINQRRDTIIAEQVRYLVFQRPRTADLLLPAPVRTIDPGAQPSALPSCLNRAVAVPPQLRAMVDLLREAPLHWLPHVLPILDRLDRLPVLQSTLESAKQRAQVRMPGALVATQSAAGGGKLGQALSNVFVAQQQIVSQYRVQTAQFDLGQLSGQSWQLLRTQASTLISLGDLIDADHGRSDVAQLSSAELDNIAQAATCLYTMFGEVLPVIRLDWAERLSQYDQPIDLRNLASLPRWGEIELLDRRAMQSIVDWLFQRIDTRQPRPVALLNDLIRVCILLASHAPVNAIIAGRLTRPTTVTAGARVEVAVDLSKIRVGMSVLLYNGPSVVAHGVVEDLSAGKAAARVLQVTASHDGVRAGVAQPSIQLDRDAQVHFSDAAVFDRAPSDALIGQAIKRSNSR